MSWKAALGPLRFDHLDKFSDIYQTRLESMNRAVEACATVGEIADAMRSVFGEHREIDG